MGNLGLLLFTFFIYGSIGAMAIHFAAKWYRQASSKEGRLFLLTMYLVFGFCFLGILLSGLLMWGSILGFVWVLSIFFPDQVRFEDAESPQPRTDIEEQTRSAMNGLTQEYSTYVDQFIAQSRARREQSCHEQPRNKR